MNSGRSINIDGVSHSAPIPMGARVGELVVSSAIPGTDPTTGRVPGDAGAQVAMAFANVRRFLSAADVGPQHVVRMTVILEDNELRSRVNEEWVAMFPAENDRPARHIEVCALPGELVIQLEVMAVDAGPVDGETNG